MTAPPHEAVGGDGLTRVDINLIYDLIPRGSSVLDLGCGDGELLARLIREKDVRGAGVEISEEGIALCVSKGLEVCQIDIDQGLEDFADSSFDYVVLNQTLQVTHRPGLVIREMLRVGRRGIVGFPNFGYYKIRCQLFFGGRAPSSPSLPFEWYNTPNIRMLTRRDFRSFCRQREIAVLQEICITASARNTGKIVKRLPNLRSEICVFVLEG